MTVRAGARSGRDARPAICMVAYTTYETDARVMRAAETAHRAGYRVDLLTPRKRGEKPRESVRGVHLIRALPRPYKGPRPAPYLFSYAVFLCGCLFKVTGLHLRRRYGIIHIHNMPDILVFSAIFARLLGAKIILDIHDPMPETYVAKFRDAKRGFLYRWLLGLERACSALAHRVLTVNEPVKTDILVKDGIPPGKITVIANFPDEGIFPIQTYPDIAGDIRMIYYGSIARRFGLDDVLEAIARVRGRNRLAVRIVGDGEAAEDIQRAIGDLGLERTVVFENRTYPLGELPKLVGTHHLGLVPYKPSPATNYMLPVKLLELAAMGIPAICVANVPIRRYFADSAFFAYDNARPASLTDLIERILERPSLLLEKRRALLQDRDKRLWNVERRKYLDVLEELSGGGTR